MKHTLRLSGSAITQCLLGLILLLLLVNVAAQMVRIQADDVPWYVAELARLFAVDAPYAVPVWFAAAALLLASLLAASAAVSRNEGKRRRGWAVLCVVAALFSLDEFAGLRREGWSILAEAGLLPLRPFMALLLATTGFVLLVRWSSLLDTHVRRWIVPGGALYLVGAFGPPLLTAMAPEQGAAAVAVTATAAAVLRMLGVVLFLRGIIEHLAFRSAAVPASSALMSRTASLLPPVFVFVALLGLLGQLSRFHLDHGRLFGFVPLFDLDAEATIPAWLSSMALLGAAAAALIAGRSEAARGKWALGWYLCSMVLAWMSMDEAASVHETLSHPLQQHFDLHGIFFMAWVIPAMGVIVLIGVAAVPFLLRLPRATRRRLIVAGAVFLVGALGFEMLGGRQWDLHGPHSMRYQLFVLGEETLELLGIALLCRALLLHLCAVQPKVVIAFGSGFGAPRISRAIIGTSTEI